MTTAACESYFPDRADISNFLRLISCWWTIANSRKKLTPNFLNNAVILNDGKIDFYKRLSDWMESWAQISDFCLTKQTSKAFVITMLMQELLDEGYEFIFTCRFQSDPLENRFSRYQQSGGRFLVIDLLVSFKTKHQLLGGKTTSQFKRMTKYLTFWHSMNQK